MIAFVMPWLLWAMTFWGIRLVGEEERLAVFLLGTSNQTVWLAWTAYLFHRDLKGRSVP